MTLGSSIDFLGMRRAGSPAVAWAAMVAWLLSAACALEGVQPRPGSRDFERLAVQRIGEVRVHLAGGNASTDRVDLVLDTRLGPLEHGAVFNSATREWTWRHDMRVAGSSFVDESGAVLDLGGVADGEAIDGTHWVRVDATHVKTKGGLVYGFDAADGRLVDVRFSDGPYPVLRYESDVVGSASRVTRVTQCISATSCSVQLSFTYDDHGCLSSAVDRAGRTADYAHDAACRTTVARDGFDVEQSLPGRRYVYGGQGQLRAIVTSEGERTALDHAHGRIVAVRQVGAGDPAHLFEYGIDVVTGGGVTRMTTPTGAVWSMSFDTARRWVRRVSPLGDVVVQTWSGLRPASLTDAAGGVWRFEYVDDDLVRLDRPSGEIVRWVHAPDAVDRTQPLRRPLERIVDGLGVREQWIYDEAGRLVTRVDGSGEVTTLTWDVLGQLESMTGPDGRTTRFFDYGEHGHATRVEWGGVEKIRIYDEVGNLEKGDGLEGELAPGRPGLVRRRFDADRHVAEIQTVETALATNNVVVKSTFIERRSDGRPRRITTPYGGEEVFVYDVLGRLVERRERVDGVERVSSIVSDSEGRPLRTRRPNGMTTELEWDEDGRLVALAHLVDDTPGESMTLTWAGGRVVRVDDSAYAQPESFEYDADGRLRVIEHATGGRTELDLDLRGRETRRRVFGAMYGALLFETTRSWDGAGRPGTTRLDGEVLVERLYLAGELRERRFGNGLTRRFEYDAQTGELGHTRTLLDTGELVEDTTIERVACWYDKLCVSVSTDVRLAGPVGGAPSWSSRGEFYQLQWNPTVSDEQLTAGSWLRMSSDVPILSIPEGDRVQFDALGNLVAHEPRTGTAVSFVYNAERNRMISGGFEAMHEFAYDEAGFATERDGVPLRWTAGGRLAAIGDDVELEWDARGRLVSRTVGGETTRYGFGGAIEIDAQGWPLALEIEDVRVLLGTNVRRYAHSDFRGNVLFVSDESGQPIRRHVYHGFGERHVVDRDGESRAPADGERGFAQGIHLAGLMLMGARPYDPDTGRFLAPDPVDHVLNDFAYTRGNPVRLWDPGGTQAGPTPAGQFAIDVGKGFMTMGAGLVAGGSAAGPAGAPVVTSGVIIFVVGVILVGVGHATAGFADSPEPDDFGGLASDASTVEFGAVCAPDHLKPLPFGRRRLLGELLAVSVLAACFASLRLRRS